MNNLNFKEHTENIVGTAIERLRFIGRTLRRCNSSTEETAYTTSVRPNLEYCCPLWNPQQVRPTHDLERFQRRAARFVLSRYRGENDTEMMKELRWNSLKERRYSMRRDLLEKFLSPTFTFNCEHILLSPIYRGRHDRHNKLRAIRSKTERFRYSFFPRAIKEWNYREYHKSGSMKPLPCT